ncbi:NAD(P)/FAD-dependent oxidoreductase [Chitinasiproducens palmae]|uniref:D-amino-acid dehydrogenase n=1 Tax=Chitinasiproducens palmae TaxID=1770053 RepID=A0A1H2PNN5_9BURK|nr:FAD-dependent oxidoreductase [Chitinasiproducens palmae]SDV48293.1 D-amino-acid dehydrogenase [Chitinasiproducens palmae]
MHSLQPRTIVIGGGLVGMCTALQLQQQGRAVTVVDPRSLKQAASLGNAGCVNGSSIVPVAMPGVVWQVPGWLRDPDGPLVMRWSRLPGMTPWLLRFLASSRPARVAAQARALRSLLAPALEAYRPLLARARATDLLRERGHTVLYSTDAGWRGDAAGMRLRADNGVAIEELDAGQLREAMPALSDRFVRGRRIAETGHFVDPGELLRRFCEHFVSHGGSFVDAPAERVEVRDGRAVAVVTRFGSLPALDVVVSAGAWSAKLARSLGDRVLLDTERGYHVEVPGAEHLLAAPVMWAEAKMFATPMAGRLRAAGTVELAGLQAPPTWRRAALLLEQLKRMFPALDAQLGLDTPGVGKWLGFRPSTPDSLPVISRASRVPNVLYGFGHGHVGLTGAAATARVLADLASGTQPALDLKPFSIQRF